MNSLNSSVSVGHASPIALAIASPSSAVFGSIHVKTFPRGDKTSPPITNINYSLNNFDINESSIPKK
jgi:hypothetical protein